MGGGGGAASLKCLCRRLHNYHTRALAVKLHPYANLVPFWHRPMPIRALLIVSVVLGALAALMGGAGNHARADELLQSHQIASLHIVRIRVNAMWCFGMGVAAATLAAIACRLAAKFHASDHYIPVDALLGDIACAEQALSCPHRECDSDNTTLRRIYRRLLYCEDKCAMLKRHDFTIFE
jgi:hypothetical protein